MNPGRFIIAAIIGGLVMFVWGAAVHMGLPHEMQGIHNLPAEEVLLPAMRTTITQRGFYMFPPMEIKNRTPETDAAWEAKLKTGPSGVLVITPGPGEGMSSRQLITEYITNALGALMLAIILVWIRATKPQAAFCGLLLGLFAWISIDASYWNWYGFPTAMLQSSLLEQAVGWMLAGFFMSLVLGRRRASPAMS
jgi:hypothetical protein